MKRLIMDLDNTISIAKNAEYKNALPNLDVVEKLKDYKEKGFTIVIYTSRNMRTYEGNLGKINAFTLPGIVNWLESNDVPFDEIIVGKPWCGNDGFYVDDRAVRPSEFVKYDYDEIVKLIEG